MIIDVAYKLVIYTCQLCECAGSYCTTAYRNERTKTLILIIYLDNIHIDFGHVIAVK